MNLSFASYQTHACSGIIWKAGVEQTGMSVYMEDQKTSLKNKNSS